MVRTGPIRKGGRRWTAANMFDKPIRECYTCMFAVRELESEDLLYCGLSGHDGRACSNYIEGYALWVREEDGNIRLVYPVEKWRFGPTRSRERREI